MNEGRSPEITPFPPENKKGENQRRVSRRALVKAGAGTIELTILGGLRQNPGRLFRRINEDRNNNNIAVTPTPEVSEETLKRREEMKQLVPETTKAMRTIFSETLKEEHYNQLISYQACQ